MLGEQVGALHRQLYAGAFAVALLVENLRIHAPGAVDDQIDQRFLLDGAEGIADFLGHRAAWGSQELVDCVERLHALACVPHPLIDLPVQIQGHSGTEAILQGLGLDPGRHQVLEVAFGTILLVRIHPVPFDDSKGVVGGKGALLGIDGYQARKARSLFRDRSVGLDDIALVDHHRIGIARTTIAHLLGIKAGGCAVVDNALVDFGHECPYLGVLHPGLGEARDWLARSRLGPGVELGDQG